MNKIRALVVDDEPLARERVLSLLQQETDVEVVAECSDGGQAVSAIQHHLPDLVFLDVQMPEMDGYEAARSIRARWSSNERARPRMIAMTSDAMPGVRELCLEAGMDDYLTKPVSIEALQTALERWA